MAAREIALTMETSADWWQCVCKAYNARSCTTCPSCGHDPTMRQVETNASGCESEAALHDEIEGYCRTQRWPYIHSRMDLPTTSQLGVADFVILMPGGKVLIVECKTKNGKQTPAQIGWQMGCERVGHKYHIVRSLDQFKLILKD